MNKKLIIILVVVILILLIVFFFLPKKDKVPVDKSTPVKEQPTTVYQPEFLSIEEKTELNIPAEMKVQALKRNFDGEIEVYKIIRNDWDIVTDPTTIGPISPRQQ